MIMPTIITAQLADAMRMPVEQVHQMLTRPEFEPFRPEKAFAGKHCEFNSRQTFIMLMAGDVVRGGIKAPWAGRLGQRIAETLLFNPDADKLHLEFRANGASFVFTTDEAPDAAEAAGPARWRMTFDLEAYRAAADAAMSDDDAE